MYLLHQKPLNKFLLGISAKKKIAPTDIFTYVLLSDGENHVWLSHFYLTPGSLELIYSDHPRGLETLVLLSVNWSSFSFSLECSVEMGDLYMQVNIAL